MPAPQTRSDRLTIAAIADYQTGIEDTISDPEVVLQVTRECGCHEFNRKGLTYDWKAATDRGTVDAMSPEARADFTPVNPGVNMSLGWDGYKTADLVHELDLAVASGKQAIFDILENRLLWMPEAVKRAFCSDSYGDGTGTTYGTNPVTGWAGGVISTGTYAGVNVATYTSIQGQVLSGAPYNTFSTDPLPALTQATLACYRGTDQGQGEYKPTHGFMDVTNFGYVLNALNDIRQSVKLEEHMATGTQTFTHMGVKWYMDRLATANRLFLGNMKFLKVQTPFKSLIQTRRQEQISPLSISLLCFFFGRMVFKNPRAFARVTTA